jgi:hypothetical protein
VLTVDEEITKLDDNLRRLKIEYDVYFGGGAKKPPVEIEWRVTSGLKRIGETMKLNYAQRFRFNAIAQRYAVFCDLWRQKMKVKEEGYRRPADAALGITGLRHEQEVVAAEALELQEHPEKVHKPFSVAFSDTKRETDKLRALFGAMVEARKKTGTPSDASFDSFRNFVQKKTEQIRREYGCHAVEYTVETQNGQVRLKAKAKI